MAQLADKALIIGCGYLGRVLARMLLERGHTVYGTTRTRAHAEQLFAMGVRPMLLSVTQRLTFSSLKPALESESLDVYYLVPPGGAVSDDAPTPRNVILGGIAYSINALRTAKGLRRAVMASSTAVYGQTGGRRVDADTPAEPVGERAQLLHKGEQLWLESNLPTHVARLAGLYGPSRIIGLKAVLDGAPIVGDPSAMLNLIHVEDAAGLLIAMMQSDDTARVELGCDGSPATRLTYYTTLAKRIKAPQPQVVTDPQQLQMLGISPRRLGRTSSKTCDNTATRRRTGWSPRYGNFEQGIEAVLTEAAENR